MDKVVKILGTSAFAKAEFDIVLISHQRHRRILYRFFPYAFATCLFVKMLEKFIVLFKDIKVNIIFSQVQTELSVYFFQNIEVEDNQVFLAQEAPTVQDAINISRTWATRGFNRSFFEDSALELEDMFEDDPEFTLYSYKGEFEIDRYIVSGAPNDHEIVILGYRNNDRNAFLSLMKI